MWGLLLKISRFTAVFDAIVDRYDCYKVETIGDSYLITSGLPQRNGHQHSEQIATLALHLLQEMDRFYIPHRPNERLLIRIGIHTGRVGFTIQYMYIVMELLLIEQYWKNAS